MLLEIGHLFFIRQLDERRLNRQALRGTPILWGCVVAVLLAQLMLTYLPLMHEVFATAPLTLRQWVVCVGIAALVFALTELEKQLRLLFPGRSRRGP